MRLTFQCCLLLLVLLGANVNAWGKVAARPKPAAGNVQEVLRSDADPDAPPARISTGDWLSHTSEEGIEDGPNLYAYVKQNPWTAFDPDGLAEVKGYYKQKRQRGVTRLEADEKGEPLTRAGANGKSEVLANHYTDWGDDKFSWFNGPQGKPNCSSWEPAKKYGVTEPTSSARGEWGTNIDRNLKAIGDAANHPTVQSAGTVARWSIELSVMAMTGGMSRARAPLQAAANSEANLLNQSYRHATPSTLDEVRALNRLNFDRAAPKIVRQRSTQLFDDAGKAVNGRYNQATNQIFLGKGSNLGTLTEELIHAGQRLDYGRQIPQNMIPLMEKQAARQLDRLGFEIIDP